MSAVTREKNIGIVDRLRGEFGFITGNFAVLVVSWLVVDFFAELPGTYYPLYVKALGGTAGTIGLIGAAEMVARGLVQIPGGYLADKYGRKWLIMTMTGLAGISRIFYVFAPTWEWIAIGAIILGLTGIYQPALEALIADSIPPERRGMGFGIVRLIGSVSTTPSPLIAGFLFLRMGLVPTMQLSYGLAAVGFVAAAVMRTRLKETVENPSKIDIGNIVKSYPTSFRESVNVWHKVESGAFVLFIINVLTTFTIGIFTPVFTLFMVDDIGIPEFQLSLIMASMFITMIIFALPSGKIIDMIGKKKPMLTGFILWTLAVPLFIYGDFWRLILAMTLIGVLQVLFSSAGAAFLADLVPKEHRGKVNGSIGFFSLIGMSIGQLIGGWMYDNVSHTLPFWIQIALMIPAFLLVLLFIKEPEKIQR